jgi:alkylation response protein AidB-like acyl-CoA dehydrogenase
MSDDVVEPLVRSVREFARDRIRALDIDREHTIPKDVLAGLAELGLFGVTLPEAYGGAGLSALDATRVVTALAEADRSVATTVGLHLGLGTRGLVAWGTAAQKERWLPKLASGEHVAAFATTEPESGSDLSALKSVAAVQPDGSLKLDGTKLYVTNGALCSVMTVTASTPGLGGAARGTSVLVVDPKAPGVLRQPEERKLGLRGSSTTAFIFEDVKLSHEHLLGEPGQGQQQLAHILSWGRLLLSAGCVGTARTALTLAMQHVHTRKQFQRTLIKQEVVQQQLTRAAMLQFGMASLVRAAASAEHDWELLSRLTTSAKVFCSEGAFEVTDLSIQLHGGAGYIEDTGVALLLRDARVTRIFEGANDVLLTHQGLVELTQPSKPAPGLSELVEDWPTAAVTALWSAVEHRRQSLRGEAKELGVRALAKKAEHHALGRAVAWRDAATAAAQYAQSPLERAAAELLLEQALRIATVPPLPAAPTAVLSHALLEGVLP